MKSENKQNKLTEVAHRTAQEYLDSLLRKYSALGRSPTPEEAAEDLNSWAKSRPVPAKRRNKAQQFQRLNEYIELANKLPPEIPAIDVGLIARSLDPSLQERTVRFSLGSFKVLLNFVRGPKIPPDFRDYILESVSAEAKSPELNLQDSDFHLLRSYGIESALRRLREFFELRGKLRDIALVGAKSAPAFHTLTFGPWDVLARSNITIDSNGILQLKRDGFAEAVHGLEASRIRKCPVCKRIFLAHPISKMSCSPRCRNVFNVRKHRAQPSNKRRT